MRSLTAAIVAVVLGSLAVGCAPAGRNAVDLGARSIPRSALIARAWAGREPPSTWRAIDVVTFAAAQIGKPYCWRGTGMACFDCSGLAQTAWGRVGVRLPRTSEDIAAALPEVPLDQVRAGDILWWPGHVGIYAGNGWSIEALDHNHGVVRRPATDPHRAFRPPTEPEDPGAGSRFATAYARSL